MTHEELAAFAREHYPGTVDEEVRVDEQVEQPKRHKMMLRSHGKVEPRVMVLRSRGKKC